MTPATRRILALAALVLPAAALTACPPPDEPAKDLGADESVKITIEADKSKIAEEEKKIAAERAKIEDERRSLLASREKLISEAAEKTDRPRRTEIDSELAALLRREREILSAEGEVDRRRSVVEARKTELLDRAIGGARGGAGAAAAGGAASDIGRREGEIAAREKTIADREDDLRKREKALAAREAKLAEGLCAGLSVPVAVPLPAAGGEVVTKKAAKSAYEKAQAAMSKRGILASDLPAGIAELPEEIEKAIAKRDYTRAKYLADSLGATVDKIKIDRLFIQAKIARLNEFLRKKGITSKDEKPWKIFLEASQDMNYGRFKAANAKINTIYGLVK